MADRFTLTVAANPSSRFLIPRRPVAPPLAFPMYSTGDWATQAPCSTEIGTEGSRLLNHSAGLAGKKWGRPGPGQTTT
jgi:hypothetical protein